MVETVFADGHELYRGYVQVTEHFFCFTRFLGKETYDHKSVYISVYMDGDHGHPYFKNIYLKNILRIIQKYFKNNLRIF